MASEIAVTTGPDEVDPAIRLVLAWLAAQDSPHTATAYGRDLGIRPVSPTGGARPGRQPAVPAWLDWCRSSGVGPLEATEDVINVYAREMAAAGLSAATRARKLAAIASWYRWLRRRGYITETPAAEIRRPKVDQDVSVTPGLTREQTVALLDAADEAAGPHRLRTAAIISVLIHTGARVSEITGADIEDLAIDRGHRVLWVTRKGGKRQALPLPGPAAERVDAYLASRDDLTNVPAIPGQVTGGRIRRVLFATAAGARLLPPDVWRLIRRIANAAGLPPDLVSRLGPHAMRHSFATLYLDSGGSLRDLQDAMGHADPRTTRRYDRARHSLDRAPGYAVAAYLSRAR